MTRQQTLPLATPATVWFAAACSGARLSLIPWLAFNARVARVFAPGLLGLWRLGTTASSRRLDA